MNNAAKTKNEFIGLKNEKRNVVTEENTAQRLGSGTLKVYATPAMIALIESCCTESVENLLGKGITSVGTRLDVEHISASPIGAEITCQSTLKEFDGRKMIFLVEVFDNTGLIGKGTHERFTVKSEKFLEKAYNKLL